MEMNKDGKRKHNGDEETQNEELKDEDQDYRKKRATRMTCLTVR